MTAAIDRIPLFATLDDQTRARLASCLTSVRLGRGDVLFREGDPGAALFVIDSGEVRVLADVGTREVCRLGPGECVGEMSVIDPAPRSATVVARRETTLWRLAAEDLDAFAAGHGQIVHTIAAALARRLRDTTAAQSRIPAERVTLIVDVRDGAPESDRLPDLLATALEATTLQRAAVMAPHAATARAVGQHVDSLLAGHGHVLLALRGEPQDDAWWRAAIDRSDLVLVLVTGAPASLASGRRVRDRYVGLLLPDAPGLEFAIDRRAEPPRAAFGPIDDLTRGFTVHTLSRTPGYPEQGAPDFEGLGRLVRRLARRRVGVALGGGGARALAHVGVLAVLEQALVPVDVLAGTSGGAIVAGLAARDWSAAQIGEFLLSHWNRRGVVDWSPVPWLSLLRGRKLDRMGREAGAGLTLEEVARPFVAVATDLVTGCEVRLRRGDGWKAVLASLSIPGVFPPVRIDDYYLVDGGAISNLPAAAAREAGADIVIGVNVTPPLDRTLIRQTLDGSPRGLLARIRGLRNGGLPLFRVIHRTISIQGKTLQAKQDGPDLTLSPDVADYDLFEFSGLEAIIERGRQEALARLDELRQVAVGER